MKTHFSIIEKAKILALSETTYRKQRVTELIQFFEEKYMEIVKVKNKCVNCGVEVGELYCETCICKELEL